MDENLNNNNELNKAALEQVVGGKGKNKECNPHDYVKPTWFTDSPYLFAKEGAVSKQNETAPIYLQKKRGCLKTK